jgi:predicted enzyme related to lactoylglutathione lyase
MGMSRSYPEGVTSWIDIEHQDLDSARTFYGELFGWTFEDASQSGHPCRYLVAQLDRQDFAGLAGPNERDSTLPNPAAWNTYVAVDDVDKTVARIAAAGGHVVHGPADASEHGQFAACTDPYGVPFRIWQAGRRPGVQVANAPGAWNFSDLHASDPSRSAAFYGAVFGWVFDDLGFATMIRRPGYGDHLAATSDPEIHTRQANVTAPPGFADAIGWVASAEPDEPPHSHVTFTVADRDATVAEVEHLGGAVLGCTDSDWTRDALVRDPWGGIFTASQFAPPTGRDW